jgi:hypothetical protein
VVASSRKAVGEALEALDMQAWALRDVSVELSPWITGTGAGNGDVFVLGRNDLWVWESPLLEFSYTSGPVRPWSTITVTCAGSRTGPAAGPAGMDGRRAGTPFRGPQ